MPSGRGARTYLALYNFTPFHACMEILIQVIALNSCKTKDYGIIGDYFLHLSHLGIITCHVNELNETTD